MTHTILFTGKRTKKLVLPLNIHLFVQTFVAEDLHGQTGVLVQFNETEEGAEPIKIPNWRHFWGFDYPRDFVTAWKATLIIDLLKSIKPQDILSAYFAADSRDRSELDAGDSVVQQVGEEGLVEIIEQDAPKDILELLLKLVEEDHNLDLTPISAAVGKGHLKWTPHFESLGVLHPNSRAILLTKAEEIDHLAAANL